MRILKWDVPVDDKPHFIGSGLAVHVQCQFTSDVVQVWTVETEIVSQTRMARVYGTGHEVPDSLVYIGTTMPNPHLVWHLFGEQNGAISSSG